jgi:hypothetical protein
METRVTNAVTGGAKGKKLARYDLIPIAPLHEVAELYGRGADKYEARNWERGYDWSLSYAAAQRHLNQFWGGESRDGETGGHHLASVVFHCLAMMEYEVTHPELDDRPVPWDDSPVLAPCKCVYCNPSPPIADSRPDLGIAAEPTLKSGFVPYELDTSEQPEWDFPPMANDTTTWQEALDADIAFRAAYEQTWQPPTREDDENFLAPAGDGWDTTRELQQMYDKHDPDCTICYPLNDGPAMLHSPGPYSPGFTYSSEYEHMLKEKYGVPDDDVPLH